MSDRDARRGQEQPAGPEDQAHVFDQTNGVLGPDVDEDDRERRGAVTPPTSFGVPPIVSL